MNILLMLVFQILYFIVCLHFFQWNGYYFSRYLKYLFKNKLIIILNLILIIQTLINMLKISNIYIFNLILLVLNIFNIILFLIKQKKNKFIFTKRILRLFILNGVILLALLFAHKNIFISFSIFTPFVLILLDLIDIYKYVDYAKHRKLAIAKLESNKDLITIGITGSNGKTSVKEILKKLLQTKFNVVVTAKNQNTPKGAIIAINKNLTDKTQVFICEMGARKKGDISQICNLVNPSKAIVTCVAPQHLETFKTQQNIYLTKKELPDHINNEYCVYNLDNSYTKQMYNEKIGAKSGVSLLSNSNLYASNIHISNYKTYFDINYNGQTFPCHTKLLGEHNVTNILLALDMALHLGVNIHTAIQVIIDLNPTPHRLEYVKSHIDIIDDSYNCSIHSARMAIKTLNCFDRTKVVCTPGIIEGGKHQFTLNQELSNLLNESADTIILVGKINRKALVSGLNNFELFYACNTTIISKILKPKFSIKVSKFDIPKISIDSIAPSTKKRAYIVNTLNDAKSIFKKLLNNNHILLILNDLPDIYN